MFILPPFDLPYKWPALHKKNQPSPFLRLAKHPGGQAKPWNSCFHGASKTGDPSKSGDQ